MSLDAGQTATTTAATGATSSGGGTTGAGGGSNTPAPASSGGIGAAMQQAAAAAGVTGQQPAAGQTAQTTPVAGQSGQVPPAGQQPPAQPQPPATIAAALAAHPELARQYAEWQQQSEEARRWAEWGQQQYALQQRNQGQGQLQGQQQGQGQQQPKNPFGIPEFDKNLMRFMARGEGGKIVPLPGCPPYAIQQYEAWNEARQQAVERIIDDPRGALAPLFEEFKQSLLAESRQIAGGTLQQAQQTAFANNFVQQNASWLYKLDANGQPQVNPVTGKRVFSEVGQLYHDAVGEIDPRGEQPLERVHAMAMRLVHGELAIRQRNAAGQQQQQAAAGQQSFIQRANAAAQGQPTLPPGNAQPPAQLPPAPGTQPQRLLGRMRQAAEAAGVLVPGTY